MNKLPKIYKRTNTGAVQEWQIIVEGNTFYTIEGQMGGTLTTSKPTVCKGKNGGKANETTDESQALAQAEAKHAKKIKKGYHLDLNDIDNKRAYFIVELAKKYNDYKDSKGFTFEGKLASRKIDGARMANVEGATTSREGEPYYSCPHIGKALEPFFEKYPDGMVDGEIYSHGEEFEKIMSLVRKQDPTEEELAESERLCKLWIFDGIVEDESDGFETRFADLKKALKETIKPEILNKYFVFVENEVVKSHEELMVLHDKYVEEGYEGIMLREKDSPYDHKRSKFLLKYKNFIDEEFIVLEFLEGEGGRSGMAGKVSVRLKDGTTCEAGIKGGEEFYKKLWNNKKDYVGKKVTVRYQGFTKYGKLRFGVAVHFDPFDR